jgi:hypothetical protein
LEVLYKDTPPHNLPKLYEIIQKGFAYEELLSELEKKIKEVRELEDKYRS